MCDTCTISHISPADTRRLAEIDALLLQEGIQRDKNLDVICAVFNEQNRIIATGSCFFNTLRCFAVSKEYKGEGLLAKLLSHLIELQFQRGHTHLFLYTKPETAPLFASLGFSEIARVPDTLVFMENRHSGFSDYLKKLKETKAGRKQSAIVMNANPFTLGHQYLIETAASQCDTLHLFLISEDVSLVPFSIRKRLVKEGCAHLSIVVLHDSGPYIISNATFPSYFLKEETAVIRGHALLDLAVFEKIASALQITERYVGEEPFSLVTGLYNEIMANELPKAGIACHIIPRRKTDGRTISASAVRSCLKNGDFALLRTLVPNSVYRYFTSPEAEPVLWKIQHAESVIHY